MKIKFEKNSKDEVVVTADGHNFASQNYIDMVKEIHAGKKLEVEFGKNVTPEEKNSINEMVKVLNSIDTKKDIDPVEEMENPEEINIEDIPF